MEYFVDEKSIVRKIWGKADTILFIFAGAAAEFALNKAVDWLYFTGRLPADPLARLVSTVSYARQIVFLEKEAAHNAIDKITAIHAGVEQKRGQTIPDWAYRDVLFMLIYYSIASFEIMERKLSVNEKEEVYDVFSRLGKRMKLKDLAANYTLWLIQRELHLEQDMAKTDYTIDLYKQYKKHLGNFRYKLVIAAQTNIIPDKALKLLGLKRSFWFIPLVKAYKLARFFKLDNLIKAMILPPKFQAEIKSLDREYNVK